MCNAYCKTNAWIRLCSWRAGSISWQVCQTASTSVWILSSGRKQILNTNRSSTKRAADAGRTGHIFRDLRVSFALQRDSLNKVNTIFCNEGASCCIYLYKVCRLTFLIEKKTWQRVQMRCTRKWSCSIQAFKRENMAKGKTAARTLTMLSTIALTRWCQDPGECGQRQFRKLKAALKKNKPAAVQHEMGASIASLHFSETTPCNRAKEKNDIDGHLAGGRLELQHDCVIYRQSLRNFWFPPCTTVWGLARIPFCQPIVQGASHRNRFGSNGDKSIEVALPSTISSDIALVANCMKRYV